MKKAKCNNEPSHKHTMTRRGMLRTTCRYGASMLLLPGVAGAFTKNIAAPAIIRRESSPLRIVRRTTYEVKPRGEVVPPPSYGALYAETKGYRLVNLHTPVRVSDDNGCSWQEYLIKPDFAEGLPHGYRRNPVTSALDPNKGKLITIVNSLDTPGLDPKQIEPPVAQFTYYLRYRVSTDGARSWAFEEPIVGEGKFTQENPFEGIYIGKNAYYIGDLGGKPLITRQGKVLVPSQTTLVNDDGTPYNPGKALTYTDVLILIGTWNKKGRLTWKAAQRVKGDPSRSTRGMIEPTLAEADDGRILNVMRGSNGHGADPEYKLPGYRWFSISEDGGEHWTDPKPWTYDDGRTFYSPSSMSNLIRHSSGRIFWLGNISEENPRGNLPRWPLVMGEVDRNTLTLIRNSIITLDTKNALDEGRGRIDISHVTAYEDRATGEFVVTHPRCYDAHKYYEYHELRIALA
jgi:hypothetical protein